MSGMRGRRARMHVRAGRKSSQSLVTLIEAPPVGARRPSTPARRAQREWQKFRGGDCERKTRFNPLLRGVMRGSARGDDSEVYPIYGQLDRSPSRPSSPREGPPPASLRHVAFWNGRTIAKCESVIRGKFIGNKWLTVAVVDECPARARGGS